MNIEHMVLDAVREGIATAIKAKFEGYQSPLNDILKSCLEENRSAIHNIINNAITSCVHDDDFRMEIKNETRRLLARNLISRLGGELEKQVNNLKADPTTRAKITLAIDEIINAR